MPDDRRGGRDNLCLLVLEEPPVVLFAPTVSNCPILSRFYLAGETPGREMRHSVYRSPYLSPPTAQRKIGGVSRAPW